MYQLATPHLPEADAGRGRSLPDHGSQSGRQHFPVRRLCRAVRSLRHRERQQRPAQSAGRTPPSGIWPAPAKPETLRGPPPDHKGSIGAWLYRQSLAGRAQASGLPPGARADLCVLDEQALSLPDLQNDDILDSAIFATSSPPVRHVMCAGQWRITNGHHPDEARLTRVFHATLRTLMAA
ncbi:hypothetical protein WH240_13105 [Gluconobacter wancherniae]|uniref:hypothetical protein n=1 Tax=Gluconobacter wancherniae TaxID=1307955 RepID=UPI003099C119